MGQVVLNITRPHYGGISDTLGKPHKVLRKVKIPSKEMIILGAILALLQVSDGILTAIGIDMFGISAEGNFFLRSLMEQWGAIPALVTAKLFAIAVIFVLCMLSQIVSWIPKAMKGVIAVYLFAAVIPWTFILFNGAL